MAIDIYYLKNKKGNLGTKLIIIYMGVGNHWSVLLSSGKVIEGPTSQPPKDKLTIEGGKVKLLSKTQIGNKCILRKDFRTAGCRKAPSTSK